MTGEEIRTLKGHNHLIPRVAYTPDGERIVTCDGFINPLAIGDLLPYDYSGEVKLWDADTGQETLALKGHQAPIICLAVSADGTQIASAGFDGMIMIWKAPPNALPRSAVRTSGAQMSQPR
jgi:WD40 repeat protein